MKNDFNFYGDDQDKEIDKILDDFREQNHRESSEPDSIGKYDFDMFMPRDGKQEVSPAEEETPVDSAPHVVIDDDFIIRRTDVPEEEPTADEYPGGKRAKRGEDVGISGRLGGRDRRGKKKRSNLWIASVVVQIGAIVLLSVFFSWAIITSMSDILALGKNEYCEVVIEKDATGAQIANSLKEAGAIKHPMLFRVFTKLKKADSTLKSGVYDFYNSIGYEGIISLLQKGGKTADEVEVVIPEGASVETIKELLVNAGACTAESFDTAVAEGEFKFDFIEDIPVERVYYRLEGYLFPNTYYFYKDDSEQSGFTALNKLIAQLNTVYTDEMAARAKELGYSMHDVLTLASVVELEASGSAEDMAKVAAVFNNRLKWTDQPRLIGSTPTVTYARKAGVSYNTEVTEGLPPGPVCNPGLDAINAVLYPADNFDYDYFVTDNEGVFYYNKTLDEHNATIKQLKREGKWDR